MKGTTSHTSVSTSLDFTREKKDLIRTIEKAEKRYSLILKKAELLKQEISDFEKKYDAKIRRLYQRLNVLESLLFKYRNISEYVDDLFSFSDAENVFEETLKDRRARMENEFSEWKQTNDSVHTVNGMAITEREELKQLYRKLARMFHPDKTGGDEQMMKYINRAYKEGNLELLRDLDLEHVSGNEDDSLVGLQNRLVIVIRRIEKVNKEMKMLRKSDMYILRRNLLKTNKANTGIILDTLAKELRKEIVKKEEELGQFKEKFRSSESPKKI